MQATAIFKRGDVVKTAAGYGIVVGTEQGSEDILVQVSLVDKPKWTKFQQDWVESVDDVSDLPAELLEALKQVDIDNNPAGSVKRGNGGGGKHPKPPRNPNIGIDGCMGYFKEWSSGYRQDDRKGFLNQDYIRSERKYRTCCAELFKQDLGKGEYERLLAEERYDEIISKALAIYKDRKSLTENIKCRMNYVDSAHGQLQRYREAIRKSSAEKWSWLLYDLLYGNDLPAAFDAFATFHDTQDFRSAAGRWTFTTVYLQLMGMPKYICVKPAYFKVTADSLGYESITGARLPTTSRPSWAEYQQYMAFAAWLKEKLHGWTEPEWALPRDTGDMLDIQAFCYIVFQECGK